MVEIEDLLARASFQPPVRSTLTYHTHSPHQTDTYEFKNSMIYMSSSYSIRTTPHKHHTITHCTLHTTPHQHTPPNNPHTHHTSLRPRVGDVLVVTSPKCGTTWVQQIVHQLRSRGSMDFEEISIPVPWIEMAHDLGQDLDAEQGFTPRAFKTHCWYDHCPKAKGAKYIVVVRDPHDVALSFFSFFQGWFFQPGEVSLDEFIRGFWLARGVPASPMQNASYFHHLVSWWQHRTNPDVLFLFYEDLKSDLPAHVAKIAAFLELDDAEARCKTAVEHSTFEFMSKHSSHFDERHSKIARNAACGLSADAGLTNGKVREGRSGAGRLGVCVCVCVCVCTVNLKP